MSIDDIQERILRFVLRLVPPHGYKEEKVASTTPLQLTEHRYGNDVTLTASEVAFRLSSLNFAEAGDSSPTFWSKVEMPDGKTAWDWIQEWPELKERMYINYDEPRTT